MPKAHISSSLQQGCIFSGDNVNPPHITKLSGSSSPIYSLAWKASLQGWTYFKESTIDVTGLTTNKDESLFFSGCDVQQPIPIQASSNTFPTGPYGSAIYEYFFITDRRMTREEFQESIGPGAIGSSGGVSFTSSPVGQESLIFGFARAYEPYAISSAGATTLNLREMWQSNFGFSRSTASSKLYCYHCAWSYTDGFTFLVTMPDTRFIVSYVADKEKDLVYLQRLKRSYDLQNELS